MNKLRLILNGLFIRLFLLRPLIVVLIIFVLFLSGSLAVAMAREGNQNMGILPEVFLAAPHPICDAQMEIPNQECDALVTFYRSTGGYAWTDKTDWLGSDTPCSWYGVTCTGGHVSGLALNNNHLVGIVPDALRKLSSLETLNLSYNALTGRIPDVLWETLTSLTVLDLSENGLKGGIPITIGNLSSLQTLNLSSNYMQFSIPTEIGSLSALQVLDLRDNTFSGSLPDSLGDLASLRELYINGNTSLSGSLPSSLTNLSLLTAFYFINTGLCQPETVSFQTWIAGIADVQSTGTSCQTLRICIKTTSVYPQ